MIVHAWLIPALPLLAAMGVALWGRRGQRWAGALTAGAAFFAFVLALKLLVTLLANPGVRELSTPWLITAGNLTLQLGMLIDPLSAIMLVIVTFVSLMVQVYSLGYMEGDEGLSRYFAYLSLFTFSMLGLVLANNLILIYMFWELVGLCSYLLIGFWYHKPEAANAAKKAFVVTRFGDMGFLIGILVLGFTLSTFNLLELGQLVHAGKLTGPLAMGVALLIFAGAMGKSAQFPLHVWLPDAMEGPTPVSALIHAATMVAAGVFLIARLFPVFSASPQAMEAIAWIGGFTALFAATIACVQSDIKRILAFSTISQLGYMVMALGCGGYSAGMFHLTTHAAYKALLFLTAGSVIHAVHQNDIWQMGGLRRRMPVTSLTLLIAALALAGIWPFSGFFSKDAVLLAALAAGRWDLLVIGIVTALLTSFYIFRLFFVVFSGKPNPAMAHAHESPAIMTLPLMFLAGLAAGLGFLEGPFNQFLTASAGAPQHGVELHNRLVPMFAFLAAIFGFGWAYLVYYQKSVSAAFLARRFSGLHRLLLNKYYVDELYLLIIRKALFGLSTVLAWFDRHVVDGAVNGVGWFCRATGTLLRQVQVGRVNAYLLAFCLGLLVLLVTFLATNPTVLAFVP